jgi:N-methylhydantoinase B/oxoprolinase/acetone carboxylase alpha subunit
MTARIAAPDPITLEILHNALRSVVDESFIALMKSAFSQNIKERRDHSTALVDARGRLIVQARDRGAAIVGIFHDAEVREAVVTRSFDMAAHAVEPSPQGQKT